MNKMRRNQILFHYNYIIKINYEVLQKSNFNNYLNVYLYRNKEKIHIMVKIAYRTYKSYTRGKVLKQWFTILK